MSITRLVYFSENAIDPASGSVVRELSKILSASNRNNKPLGLTGALVFDDLWFLQALEGDRNKVWSTFERIKDDARHADVTLVDVRDAPERIFGNWWMGLAKRDTTTEVAFKPYLRGNLLGPHAMSSDQILALMIDLARIGLSRELAPRAA